MSATPRRGFPRRSSVRRMDGVVSLRNVNVGDFVGEMGAKPMFRIVDNRILDLTVTVPSGEMGALRIGPALTFSTDALPGKVFHGKSHVHQPDGERSGSVGEGGGRG